MNQKIDTNTEHADLTMETLQQDNCNQQNLNQNSFKHSSQISDTVECQVCGQPMEFVILNSENGSNSSSRSSKQSDQNELLKQNLCEKCFNRQSDQQSEKVDKDQFMKRMEFKIDQIIQQQGPENEGMDEDKVNTLCDMMVMDIQKLRYQLLNSSK